MIGKKVKVEMGQEYSIIPMDKYTCQITDVSEKTKVFSGEEKYGFNYELTILDNKLDNENEALRGRKLWYWVSANVTPRSYLGKLINAVYKIELSKEQMAKIDSNGFDADALVGKQIDVLVENKEGVGSFLGRTFSNVASVFKVTKELKGVDPKEPKVTEEEKKVAEAGDLAVKPAEEEKKEEVKSEAKEAEEENFDDLPF